MARFTVILPEGSVLLRNDATGQTLTLSASGSPLVLGEIEMQMTLSPAPFVPVAPAPVSEPVHLNDAPAAPAVPAAAAAPVPPAAPAAGPARKEYVPTPPARGDEMTAGLSFSHVYDNYLLEHGQEQDEEKARRDAAFALPPGFGPDQGEPMMSPEKPLMPGEQPPSRGIRVLEAPFSALTPEDFDRTLENLALRRNNIESEMEFLEEIEGDPQDIEELAADIRQVDEDFASVIERRKAWEASLKPRDED